MNTVFVFTYRHRELDSLQLVEQQEDLLLVQPVVLLRGHLLMAPLERVTGERVELLIEGVPGESPVLELQQHSRLRLSLLR